MAELSIIIINYNNVEVSIDCINSITKESPSLNFEIIVIDNASTKGNAEELKDKFPQIQFYQLEENLGFGMANNFGIEKANGEFILLLNSDTIVLDNALEKCVEFMRSPFALDNNIGLMGCEVLNEDKTEQRSTYRKSALTSYILYGNIFISNLKARFGDNSIRQKEGFVQAISGSFMFFRGNLIKNINAFDPDIFLFSEETDLCRRRVSKKGRIYYWKGANIIHLGGKSTPNEHGLLQQIISFGFGIYKDSILKYLIFIKFFLFNLICLTIFEGLKLLLGKSVDKIQLKANFQAVKYFFGQIPFMRRAWGANKKQLRSEYFSKN